MTVYRTIVAAFVISVAAALQMTMASRIAIGQGRPDILLTTVVCVSLLVGVSGASAAGVWGGLLMATLVGINFGSFLASRTLAGIISGWLGEQPVREGILVAPIFTFGATIICESAYYVMAPSHQGTWWLGRVALEALYNAALSAPIVAALRKVGLKGSSHRH